MLSMLYKDSYRLPRPIEAHYEGQRGVELNRFTSGIVERPNTARGRISLVIEVIATTTHPSIESLSIFAVIMSMGGPYEYVAA